MAAINGEEIKRKSVIEKFKKRASSRCSSFCSKIWRRCFLKISKPFEDLKMFEVQTLKSLGETLFTLWSDGGDSIPVHRKFRSNSKGAANVLNEFFKRKKPKKRTKKQTNVCRSNR